MILNYVILGIVVVIVLLLLHLVFKFDKPKFIELTGTAVESAEYYFRSGEGDKKMTYVLNIIRPFLPWYLNIFITERTLAKFVECVLAILQPYFKSSLVDKGDDFIDIWLVERENAWSYIFRFNYNSYLSY